MFQIDDINKKYWNIPVGLLQYLAEHLDSPLTDKEYARLKKEYGKYFGSLPKAEKTRFFYRGVSLSDKLLGVLFRGGQIRPIRMFESWSSEESVASDFGSIIFKKEVPKGDRLVYLPDLLKDYEHKNEMELVAKGQVLSLNDLTSIEDFLSDDGITPELLTSLLKAKNISPEVKKKVVTWLQKNSDWLADLSASEWGAMVKGFINHAVIGPLIQKDIKELLSDVDEYPLPQVTFLIKNKSTLPPEVQKLVDNYQNKQKALKKQALLAPKPKPKPKQSSPTPNYNKYDSKALHHLSDAELEALIKQGKNKDGAKKELALRMKDRNDIGHTTKPVKKKLAASYSEIINRQS